MVGMPGLMFAASKRGTLRGFSMPLRAAGAFKPTPWVQIPALFHGRGGGIRTHGLLVPNEARYQAALRPEFKRGRWSTEVVHPKGLEPLTF